MKKFSKPLFYVLLAAFILVIISVFFHATPDGVIVLPSWKKLWVEVSSSARVLEDDAINLHQTLSDIETLIDQIDFYVNNHTYNPIIDNPLGGPHFVDGKFYENNLINFIYLELVYFIDVVKGGFATLGWTVDVIFLSFRALFLLIALFLTTLIELISLPLSL